MAKRVLAILSKDEVLKELVSEIEAKQAILKTRIDFLKKQARDAAEKAKEEAQVVWDKIEAHLRATGALDKYDKDNQHLCYSFKRDSMDLHDNEDHGTSILKALGLESQED